MGIRDIFLSNNCKFDVHNIKDWHSIVENITLVVLKQDVRECKNIDVMPKIGSRNNVKFYISCLKHDGSLDEYILDFDILGCKDLGYYSEVSKVWRECLEYSFGKEYCDFCAKKLKLGQDLEW